MARKKASETTDKPAKAKKPPKPKRAQFEILIDSREQKKWDFPPDPDAGCLGSSVEGLPTGDYTVRGLERILCIERKGTLAEFAQNITQARFTRELDRLKEYPFAFVILEFEMTTIRNFPAGSGIPQQRWKYLRTTKEYIQRRLAELMVAYPSIHWVLAGDQGREMAYSLMKRVIDATSANAAKPAVHENPTDA